MTKIDNSGQTPDLHFASLMQVASPIIDWMEKNLGAVSRSGFKYLECRIYDVVVRAEVSEFGVEWFAGVPGRVSRVGVTQHGVILDDKVPGPVMLAVRLVKQLGGSGL